MNKFSILSFLIVPAFLPNAFAKFEQLKDTSVVESKIESIADAFAGQIAHESRFTSADRSQRSIDPAISPCTVSIDKAAKTLTLHVDGKSIVRSYDRNRSNQTEGREISWQRYEDTAKSERGDIKDAEWRANGWVLARSLSISRNGDSSAQIASYVEFPLVAFDEAGTRIESPSLNSFIANSAEYTCWFD